MLVAKNGLEYVSFDADETLGLLRLIGLVFVPFLIGLYWMWNENRVVDGANDNLSGCYMGIAILKALKEEGIEFETPKSALSSPAPRKLVCAAQRRGARLIRASSTMSRPSSSLMIRFTIPSIL